MLGAGEKAAASWSHMGIYDDNHHLVPEAEPYTSSSTLRKLNHPLMIMVEEARVVSLLLFPATGHATNDLFFRAYWAIHYAWLW